MSALHYRVRMLLSFASLVFSLAAATFAAEAEKVAGRQRPLPPGATNRANGIAGDAKQDPANPALLA